jgi:hypothetical protein
MTAIDFTCFVCGAECDIAPDPPLRAICRGCCDDHNYVYIAGERRHECEYCGAPRPDDWSDE